MKRITVIIPTPLDANLGIVAARRGVSKSEICREALTDLVKKERLDPTRTPKRIVAEY